MKPMMTVLRAGLRERVRKAVESMLVRGRFPIQEERDWETCAVPSRYVHQETAVGGHGVLPSYDADSKLIPELKQFRRRAGLECCTSSSDRNCHQVSIQRNVIQLAPVVPPARRTPASRRNLRWCTRSRKGTHINLKPPRLV